MSKIKSLLVLVLTMSLFFVVKGQEQSLSNSDITGLWRGTLYNDTTQLSLKYEIAISLEGKKYTGYSHTFFIDDDKIYHGIKKLKITIKDEMLFIADDGLMVNNYPEAPPKGVKGLGILKLSIINDSMVLSGSFETNRTKTFRPLTGSIVVSRKNDFNESALMPHLEELKKIEGLSFVAVEKEAGAAYPTYAYKNKPVVAAPITVAVIKPTEKIETPPVVAKVEPSVEAPKPTEKVIPPTVVAKAAPKVEEPKPAGKVTPPSVVAKTEPKPVVKVPPTPKSTTPAVVKVAPPDVKTVVKPVAQPKVETPPIVKQPTPTNTIITQPSVLAEAAKRKVETIESNYFESDSLLLTLYDNGEVDGDSVSLIMNGQVLMANVGLSTNAVKKVIYTASVGDSIQLIMHAESLGSLPPNSGLLIVQDGKKRYEIRFRGDMQKSSAIVFRRKKN